MVAMSFSTALQSVMGLHPWTEIVVLSLSVSCMFVKSPTM